MKILSIKPITTWYIVTDLPYITEGRRLEEKVAEIGGDCRLYEISASGDPGKSSLTGLLVAGKDEADAKANVQDILRIYLNRQ